MSDVANVTPVVLYVSFHVGVLSGNVFNEHKLTLSLLI